MDKIIIQGLQVHSLIGVYDWERESKQCLLVDVTLSLDLHRAAQTDEVEDTVDYAALAAKLVEVADQCEFQLLEALAQKMIDTLFSLYPLLHISLRITKPDILPHADQVAVELSRER